MRWTARHHAAADEVFAPGAFTNVVGLSLPLTIMGNDVGQVRLVAVSVAPDGRSVELTFEPVEDAGGE